MARRVLLILAVLVVVGFLYFGYSSYDAGRIGANGDVYSNDPPPNKARRASETAPIRNDDAKPNSNEPVAPYPASQPKVSPSQSASQVAPYPASQPKVSPSQSASQVAPALTAQPGSATLGAATVPTADTISPNPPNGMVFSGTGHFQLYRQGNITWRLNTDTGQSCILFATDEEWKKPRVLHAGCGKS